MDSTARLLLALTAAIVAVNLRVEDGTGRSGHFATLFSLTFKEVRFRGTPGLVTAHQVLLVVALCHADSFESWPDSLVVLTRVSVSRSLSQSILL